jgi:hypothetical protein
MRYRVTLEQVMTMWYATVTTWEPDGHTIEKRVEHFSFPMSEADPADLTFALSRLTQAMWASH